MTSHVHGAVLYWLKRASDQELKATRDAEMAREKEEKFSTNWKLVLEISHELERREKRKGQ